VNDVDKYFSGENLNVPMAFIEPDSYLAARIQSEPRSVLQLELLLWAHRVSIGCDSWSDRLHEPRKGSQDEHGRDRHYYTGSNAPSGSARCTGDDRTTAMFPYCIGPTRPHQKLP
jgi:hypothetical protein